MPKSKKVVYVKPITDHNKIQIDIKKTLDDDKKSLIISIFKSVNFRQS
jgi:hypothetical protein